jgi:hypothetical protein
MIVQPLPGGAPSSPLTRLSMQRDSMLVAVIDDDEAMSRGGRLLSATGYRVRTFNRRVTTSTISTPPRRRACSSTSVCPTSTDRVVRHARGRHRGADLS